MSASGVQFRRMALGQPCPSLNAERKAMTAVIAAAAAAAAGLGARRGFLPSEPPHHHHHHQAEEDLAMVQGRLDGIQAQFDAAIAQKQVWHK